MKVTRGREVRVNLGNFEHMVTSATVEQEFPEETYKISTLANGLDRILDGLLESDIKDALNCTSLDDDASFVYSWTEVRYGR